MIALGFHVVREGNHVPLERSNADGSTTPMTLRNHKYIKSSTLRTILTQAGVTREDFLLAFESA